MTASVASTLLVLASTLSHEGLGWKSHFAFSRLKVKCSYHDRATILDRAACRRVGTGIHRLADRAAAGRQNRVGAEPSGGGVSQLRLAQRGGTIARPGNFFPVGEKEVRGV